MVRIFKAIGAYVRAVQLAGEYGLWKYVLIPGFISLLIGLALVFLTINAAPLLSAKLFSWYPWEFGKSVAAWSAVITSYLIIISISFIAYKYIVLIVTFPFMSFLSQKVEKSLYGRIAGENAQPMLQFINELGRGVGISTLLIMREMGWTLLLLLLSLIPGLAVITGPAIFLVQSYYAGCGNMDYTLERYYNIRDSLIFMRRNADIALGNGCAFIVLLGIPLIGIFFAPILGTIAATTQTLDVLEEIDYGG